MALIEFPLVRIFRRPRPENRRAARMDADLVRAAGVRSSTSASVGVGERSMILNDVSAGLPSSSTRTMRSPPCRTDLRSGAFDVELRARRIAGSSARYCFVDVARRGSGPAAPSSAARFRASTSTPLVSRSSRCASSSVSSGRAARSSSIAPKLTPLPPWLATPAGLSMTR